MKKILLSIVLVVSFIIAGCSHSKQITLPADEEKPFDIYQTSLAKEYTKTSTGLVVIATGLLLPDSLDFQYNVQTIPTNCILSPNKTRCIYRQFIGYDDLPDPTPILYDIRNHMARTIDTCGSSCRYGDSEWVGDDTLVIEQDTEYNPIKKDLCNFSDTGCVFVSLLVAYNVKDLTHITKQVYSGTQAQSFMPIAGPKDGYYSIKTCQGLGGKVVGHSCPVGSNNIGMITGSIEGYYCCKYFVH